MRDKAEEAMHQIDTKIDTKKPLLVVLEGNIGAGKSTLLRLLSQKMHMGVVEEPTGKWQQVGNGNNLLDLFYKDIKRWAYTFQSYAFISRVQAILEYQKHHSDQNFCVLERSVYCDYFCFAKNCYEIGLMSYLEWQIYKEWFSWLAESYAPRPAGFIYLRTNPQTCLKRIASRGRQEEQSISLSYLEALHNKHEDWLIKKIDVPKHVERVPVLLLDCDHEFETDIHVQATILGSIEKFIISISSQVQQSQVQNETRGQYDKSATT